MEREDALKSLELIQTIVEQTRREVDQSGPFLILWGMLILIASSVQHILVFSGVTNWVPFVALWSVFGALGGIGSGIIGWRIRKTTVGRIVNSMGRKIAVIWTGIGVSVFLLSGLSLNELFPPQYIWALATLFDGVGLLATGIFTEERIWIALSILCLPLVSLMLIYPTGQFLMFGVFFGISYITVGMASKRSKARENVFPA